MNGKLLLGIAISQLLFSVCPAQSGGTFQIEKSAVVSGGTMSGGSYSLTATAGQTEAGRRQTGVRYSLSTGFWTSDIAPTAANVSVSGRITTSSGAGLRNAIVTMTDASGQTRVARSSSFGYYNFDEVQAGQTYVFAVTSKSYQFVPQILTVDDNVGNLDFAALP